jgi:hypothetical protein
MGGGRTSATIASGGEQDPLREADRHLAEVRNRIARQDRLVRTMQAAGHDTTLARDMLAALRGTHAALTEYRRVMAATLALADKVHAAAIGPANPS